MRIVETVNKLYSVKYRKRSIEDDTFEEIETGTLSTKIRPATDEEFNEELSKFNETKLCKHKIINGGFSWDYNSRVCSVCGRNLNR